MEKKASTEKAVREIRRSVTRYAVGPTRGCLDDRRVSRTAQRQVPRVRLRKREEDPLWLPGGEGILARVFGYGWVFDFARQPHALLRGLR